MIFVSIVKRAKKVVDNYFVGTNDVSVTICKKLIGEIYEKKADLIYTLIVFILPLIICYALIYSQLGYTC